MIMRHDAYLYITGMYIALLWTPACGLFAPTEALKEQDCIMSIAAGDGIDNDGDGIIDEGCACPFDNLNTGVCALGIKAQNSSACQEPANYYAVEVYLCDGLDNNCDGLVDQGCRCEANDTNVGVCALGRVDVTSGACMDSPLLQSKENQCDGYDNDCDGATDEDCEVCDFQGSTTGACAFGVINAQGVCAPPLAYIKDEAEQCARDPLAGDGVDNDCDGQIDEGCACQFGDMPIGVCALGVQDGNGLCGTPVAYELNEARCDGLDNDCDGQVDESCAVRQEPPERPDMCAMTVESCDGSDNNCNGIVDEGCAPPECVPTSSKEVCDDGMDNNCDGQIDETCMGPVEALSLHTHHTCAIARRDASVWCWGWRAMSSTTTQTDPDHFSPRRVGTLTDVRHVATGGSHNCALKGDGTVWCWGRNDRGQLGDGTTEAGEITSPIQVQGLDDVTHVSLGAFHGCAIRADQSLWCWGWNLDGQLGDGTSIDRSAPVQVQSWRDVEDVQMTEYRTCMRRSFENGSIWCMGENSRGLLGDGQVSADRTTPVQALGLNGVTEFVLSPGLACAVKLDNTVWCWGVNSSGEVGDGTTTDRSAPTQVEGLTDAIGLFDGLSEECTILGDGPDSGWSCDGSTQTMCAGAMANMWSCWGRNDQGQLGRGTQSMRELTASPVDTSVPLRGVVTDRNEHCGIDAQGGVWCWGLVSGEGPWTTPQKKMGIVDVTKLGMGRSHACALQGDGGVWCWGVNAYGQLGDGTTTTSHAPVKIN